MTWWQWLLVSVVVCGALVVWLFCNMARQFITKPDEQQWQVPPKEGR